MHNNTKHRIVTKRRTARRATTTWRTVHWNEFQHWLTHTQSLGPRSSPENKHTWWDTSGELTKYMYGRKWIASHCRPVYRFQECWTIPNCWLHLFRFTPHFFHGVLAAFPSAPWSSPNVWRQPFRRLKILSGPTGSTRPVILSSPELTPK